ncbi:hypothetical protein V9L05_18885 [Bernardetia sp. Wsw4-3y2]|uniref:hypothetical protein n=1 Tax=Bernardetia sp. Wsw4-3y2 TaxID=3127471 RepID=UPI0030D04CB1
MTLPFSTHWADKTPNYFVGKIWCSILKGLCDNKTQELRKKLYEQSYFTLSGKYIERTIKEHQNDFFGHFGIEIDYPTDLHPKLHTLREDKKDRWQAGKKIHPVIHNRTKNRFQFAPTMECKGIQRVTIINFFVAGYFKREVYIDSKLFYILYSQYPAKTFLKDVNEKMLQFVKNDGFGDIDSFFKFFFPKGSEGTKELKLIHWTDLTY